MTKLFVGNLPYSVNDASLAEMFQAFANVATAVVITDKFSGRSKGFGFVEIESDEEANRAIAELNGKDMDGRAIIVSVARPREDRPDRPRSGGGNFRR